MGVLERLGAVGELRVLDGLIVANDTDTGELVALDLRSGSSGDAVARLLTFRLDPGARRAATEKALGESGSVPADIVRSLGDALQPGHACSRCWSTDRSRRTCRMPSSAPAGGR